METRSAKRRPTHPGALLREIIIPDSGIGVGRFADALDMTRQNLDAILGERRRVTPGVALRLGQLLGNEPQFWLNMQNAVELYEAERKNPEIRRIRRLETIAAEVAA